MDTQTAPLDRQRAFFLLFRGKTYQAVWSWLRRLGVPRRDRWDLAQDVLLAGYQSFPTYDPLRARPERWLNRITVHVAAHYRDRACHRREEFASEDDPGITDERPGAEERIVSEETRALLLDRLDALHPDERAVLVEHDIDGIPMATIAAVHGIPLSTAYKWRTRALSALRSLVEEEQRRDGKPRKKNPGALPPRTKAPPSRDRAAAAKRPAEPPELAPSPTRPLARLPAARAFPRRNAASP
jgi:RNA polymerase sigma-70 factor, ECF subfamily